MKRFSDVRTTYLYLVCFAMLIIAAVGVVRAGSVGLDLLIYGRTGPPPVHEYRPAVLRTGDGDVTVPQELIQAQIDYEQRYRAGWPVSAAALAAGLSLVGWGLPLYALHWRLVRREEGADTRPFVPWGARSLYIYLVSAVALGMIVGGGHRAVVEAAGGVQNYVWSPGPLEVYERSLYEPGEPLTVEGAIAEAEQARERDYSYQRYYQWRRVAGGVLSLVVGLALYIPHWRWASRGLSGGG